MAIDQASLFFFAPRHGPVILNQEHGDRESKIISHQLVDADAPIVLAGDVSEFFKLREFSEIERWGNGITLGLDPNSTFEGRQHEIVVQIPEDGDEEISYLYIRFLITRSATKSLDRWNELSLSLGDRFAMKIMTDDLTLVPCIDFKTVMTHNRAYHVFTKLFGRATSE